MCEGTRDFWERGGGNRKAEASAHTGVGAFTYAQGKGATALVTNGRGGIPWAGGVPGAGSGGRIRVKVGCEGTHRCVAGE